MRTREELESMTMKQLKAYAKEIGCCLGYSGSRKDTAIGAIVAHQRHLESVGSSASEPKKHPWREFRSVNKMPSKEWRYFCVREDQL